MSLTIEDKAIAMNLAMNIDLGNVDLAELIKEIKKNKAEWTEILEFYNSLSSKNQMLDTVLNRIYLECLYQI